MAVGGLAGKLVPVILTVIVSVPFSWGCAVLRLTISTHVIGPTVFGVQLGAADTGEGVAKNKNTMVADSNHTPLFIIPDFLFSWACIVLLRYSYQS